MESAVPPSNTARSSNPLPTDPGHASRPRGINRSGSPVHIHEAPDRAAAVTPLAHRSPPDSGPANISRLDSGEVAANQVVVASRPVQSAEDVTLWARQLVSAHVLELRTLIDHEGDDEKFEQQLEVVNQALSISVQRIAEAGKTRLSPTDFAVLKASLGTIETVFTSIGRAESDMRRDSSRERHESPSMPQLRSWCASRMSALDLMGKLPAVGTAIVCPTSHEPHNGLRELLCWQWRLSLYETRDIKAHALTNDFATLALQVGIQTQAIERDPQATLQVLKDMEDAFAQVKNGCNEVMECADLCRANLMPLILDPGLSQDLRHMMKLEADIRSTWISARELISQADIGRFELIQKGFESQALNAAWLSIATSISTRADTLCVTDWVLQASKDMAPASVCRAVLRVFATRYEDLSLDCRYLRAQLSETGIVSPIGKEAARTLGDLADFFDDFKSRLRSVVGSLTVEDSVQTLTPRQVREQVNAYVKRFVGKPASHTPSDNVDHRGRAHPHDQERTTEPSGSASQARSQDRAAERRSASSRSRSRGAQRAERAAKRKQLAAANTRIADLCSRDVDVDGPIGKAQAVADDVQTVVHGKREDWVSADSVFSLVTGAANTLLAARLELESRLDSLKAWLGQAEKLGQPSSTATASGHDPGAACTALSNGADKLRLHAQQLHERAERLQSDQLCNVYLQHTTTESFLAADEKGLLRIQRERPGRHKLLEVFWVRVPQGKFVRIVARVRDRDGQVRLEERLVNRGEIHWHFPDDEATVPSLGSHKNEIQAGEVGDIVDRGWVHEDDVEYLYNMCVERSQHLPTVYSE